MNAMKSKKLFLPAVILAAVLVVTVVWSLVSSIARKPTVTEGEFPFSITYELDGETVTVNGVYKARYVKNGGYADTKLRIYEGEIGTMGEGNTVYLLKEDESGRIELCTNFYADHLMGDTPYNYFDEYAFAPRIYYYDTDELEYSDEETLAAHGVKLIDYEYPTPIKNSLVFSHFSYFSSGIVFSLVLIALPGLIAMIIFIKRDKERKHTPADVISIALNFMVGLILLPFLLIVSLLIDVNGGGPELYRQILYFIPSLQIWCIAASVALRRRGYRVGGLIAVLTGPAVFAVYLVVCGLLGLL